MPDSVSADSLHLLRLTASERTRLLRRVPRGVEIYRAPQQILADNGKVFTGRFHKTPVEVLFDAICVGAPPTSS
jgi:hypothetical protein